MRFKVMPKSMKSLLLAGILSLAAASAAQAGGRVTGSDFDRCPVLADDTGPGNPGDHNGRSAALGTDSARSGQVPALWRSLVAEDTGLGNPGDHNGGTTAF